MPEELFSGDFYPPKSEKHIYEVSTQSVDGLHLQPRPAKAEKHNSIPWPPTSRSGGDEDKWDGFDIPRGIVLRLIDWFKE
jgi:hypothetical protein